MSDYGARRFRINSLCLVCRWDVGNECRITADLGVGPLLLHSESLLSCNKTQNFSSNTFSMPFLDATAHILVETSVSFLIKVRLLGPCLF